MRDYGIDEEKEGRLREHEAMFRTRITRLTQPRGTVFLLEARPRKVSFFILSFVFSKMGIFDGVQLIDTCGTRSYDGRDVSSTQLYTTKFCPFACRCLV